MLSPRRRLRTQQALLCRFPGREFGHLGGGRDGDAGAKYGGDRALNNIVYVSKRDARKLRVRDQEQYCEVGECVYIFRPDDTMEEGIIDLEITLPFDELEINGEEQTEQSKTEETYFENVTRSNIFGGVDQILGRRELVNGFLLKDYMTYRRFLVPIPLTFSLSKTDYFLHQPDAIEVPSKSFLLFSFLLSFPPLLSPSSFSSFLFLPFCAFSAEGVKLLCWDSWYECAK